MAEDIAQWLNRLGLGQYAQTFADNGIDIEALPHLRDEDFERLGVLLGHMRRLQTAIETLSAAEVAERLARSDRPTLSRPLLRLQALDAAADAPIGYARSGFPDEALGGSVTRDEDRS